MSGPPSTTRDALMQAVAQRNAGAAGGGDPTAQAAPAGPDPGQVAQACGLAGQLLKALAQNPQAIQQIMAAAQGGGAPQPSVPGQ